MKDSIVGGLAQAKDLCTFLQGFRKGGVLPDAGESLYEGQLRLLYV